MRAKGGHWRPARTRRREASPPESASLPAAQAPSTAFTAGATQPALPAAAKRHVTNAYAKLPLAFIPNAARPTTPCATTHRERATASTSPITRRCSPSKRATAARRFSCASWAPTQTSSPRRPIAPAARSTTSPARSATPTSPPTGGSSTATSGPASTWSFAARAEGSTTSFASAGAKASDIRLAYAGADHVSLGAGGALLIETPLGTLRDAAPRSFQRIDGRRVAVKSRYALAGDSYGLAIADHDRSRPLLIDPSLYSTYLGGNHNEAWTVGDIAVDAAGAAYVTGETDPADFPATAGAFDTSCNCPGGNSFDAFVTKLNPAGSGLAYSTYLGGTAGATKGWGIAVDAAGAAYVTGSTSSASFPTTAVAFDTSYNGGDAFVTKLNPSGSNLA